MTGWQFMALGVAGGCLAVALVVRLVPGGTGQARTERFMAAGARLQAQKQRRG